MRFRKRCWNSPPRVVWQAIRSGDATSPCWSAWGQSPPHPPRAKPTSEPDAVVPAAERARKRTLLAVAPQRVLRLVEEWVRFVDRHRLVELDRARDVAHRLVALRDLEECVGSALVVV